jgi:hypothetical protein
LLKFDILQVTPENGLISGDAYFGAKRFTNL